MTPYENGLSANLADYGS